MTAIFQEWYANAGKPYDINYVSDEGATYAQNADTFLISFPAGDYVANLRTSSTNSTYAAFWRDSTASYDPTLGIITGVSKDGTHFSISLDRSRFKAPFNINVFVEKAGGGVPAPEDGSWTGTGRS